MLSKGSPKMTKYKRIVIIGYRATGKSTVARMLAKQLDWTYFSTDEMVVHEAQKSIADIVKESGWKKFRDMEHEVIRSASKLTEAIIDCGGGVVEYDSNMRSFKSESLIIWIDAEMNDILSRISKDRTVRPLLTEDDLDSDTEKNYKQRQPLYQKYGDLRYSSSNSRPEEICHLIQKELTLGN